MKRTIGQNKRLHFLLNATGQEKMKAQLALSFSDGRTDETSMLDYFECNMLIDYLQIMFNKTNGKYQGGNDDDVKKNQIRRKILSICHQIGWYKRDSAGNLILKNTQPQLDMDRIDRFCIEKGKFKKPLQAHDVKELSILVTQFDKILKHQINA